MNNIKVLDCTLRDGGYINNWEFGESCIVNVISKLVKSGVDFIECGYLNHIDYQHKGKTQFSSTEEIGGYLPLNCKESLFVAMIDYGNFDINKLPKCADTCLSGIRVCFHKKDLQGAIEFCSEIKDLGYDVFVQPMATITYSDMELLSLINLVNKLMPYACYIVDSFGVMKRNEILRLFYLLDHNLENEIALGYHAHNNIQMAYSNAQTILDLHSNRRLIVDASILGMGRGAGNLNTELLVDYLNENFSANYKMYPMLEVIDEEINKIYNKHYWGYSLPHYLSSVNNCHPNYATYLSKKNTLSIQTISEILSLISDDEKNEYSKDYIEELYRKHQSNDINDVEVLQKLQKKLDNHEILVIAPGSSITREQEKISDFIAMKNPIIITVNFVLEYYNSSVAFFSNQKRFLKWQEKTMEESMLQLIIATSNLQIGHENENIALVNYNKLIVNNEKVRDNAVLMLLNLLYSVGCKKVTIAGLDGYVIGENNYYKSEMDYVIAEDEITNKNMCIETEINRLKEKLDIQFITTTNYRLNT